MFDVLDSAVVVVSFETKKRKACFISARLGRGSHGKRRFPQRGRLFVSKSSI